MICLGVDPGSKKCGWAIVDSVNKTVLHKGHGEIGYIRMLLADPLFKIECMMVETVVRYGGSNSIDLLGTAFMIGRLRELADHHVIPLQEITRPDIILKVSGKRSCKGYKVSKADMQILVKNILGLQEVVRPQHANDAVAVVVALTHPVNQIVKQPTVRKKRQTKKSGGDPKSLALCIPART